MGDVVEFPGDSEFSHVSYTAEEGGETGLSMLDRSLGMAFLNDTQVVIITPDGTNVVNRVELAEFAWVLAYFLDSQQKMLPRGDLIGRDYPEPPEGE